MTCSWLLNSMAITSSVLLAAPACRREYVEDKTEDDEDMAFASAPLRRSLQTARGPARENHSYSTMVTEAFDGG